MQKTGLHIDAKYCFSPIGKDSNCGACYAGE